MNKTIKAVITFLFLFPWTTFFIGFLLGNGVI